MKMPDFVYASNSAWDNYAALVFRRNNDFEKSEIYHHARIVKAKDARILELETFIQSRGIELP